MSGEVVNLRQHRKRKGRDVRENEAEANRLLFGRTKTEKQITEAQAKAASRKLDAHKRDDR
ncbi:MAG: DUF4169 family protein [Methylobacterium mesophilicum]|nr:DUF4169 family protein [Methylobacterium mesophilicum]